VNINLLTAAATRTACALRREGVVVHGVAGEAPRVGQTIEPAFIR